VSLHVRVEEEAVDDQLLPAFEQVDQFDLSVRAIELIDLLDLQPRHAAPLGRQRVARPHVFFLLDQQLLPGRHPVFFVHCFRYVHGFCPFLLFLS